MNKDTVTKDFIKDNRIFADLFNQYIYDGRQVIRPEELAERDPAEIALPYGDDGPAGSNALYQIFERREKAAGDHGN